MLWRDRERRAPRYKVEPKTMQREPSTGMFGSWFGGAGELVSCEAIEAGIQALEMANGAYAVHAAGKIAAGKISVEPSKDFTDATIDALKDLSDVVEWRGVETDGRPGGYAITATQPDGSFLISFKGTSTVEDAEQDVRAIRRVKISLGGSTYVAGSGFRNQYEEIKRLPGAGAGNFDAVVDSALSGKDRTVHVVGHSLGGALANLCAVDIVRKYPRCTVFLRTIGCTRTFDPKSCQRIVEELSLSPTASEFGTLGQPGKIAAQRWLSYGDTVPSLPPSTRCCPIPCTPVPLIPCCCDLCCDPCCDLFCFPLGGYKHTTRGFYINQRIGGDLTVKVQHRDFSAYNWCGFACVGTHKISTHTIDAYRSRMAMAKRTHTPSAPAH